MKIQNPKLYWSLPQIAGAVVSLIGSIALAGWIFDITAFKSILPSFVTMKANTAICLLLSGISLWVLSTRPSNRLISFAAQFLALIVTLSGLLAIIQYIFGLNLGIDQLLFTEPITAIATSHPGRMAFSTAINFLIFGTGLLLLRSPGYFHLIQIGVFIGLLNGLINLIGYLYGVHTIYSNISYTPMALHTILAFILLGTGILSVYPNLGLMATLTSRNTGGKIFRLLLSLIIIVPIALGWLRLQGEESGFYSHEVGISIMVLLIIIIVFAVIWSYAASLNSSDRKRIEIEEALRLREEQFRVTFERAPIAKCLTDPSGRLRQVNQEMCKMLGYTEEELMGINFASVTYPDDMAISRECVQTLLSGKQDIYRFEKRYVSKNGQILSTFVSSTLLRDSDNQPIYFITHIQDITERKKNEEKIIRLNLELQQKADELGAVNKELEAFAYSVSHDLRAPLRAVNSFASILLDDYKDKLDDEGKRLLGIVCNNATRMGQLIDDLLAFSRTGRKEVAKSELQMEELVKSVVDELVAQVSARVIHCSIGKLPPAFGDFSLIHQVFANLIGNAIKFTRTKNPAVIEIGCRTQDGENVYYVTDNGVGFDMKYAHKLFGVFQRLHGQEEFEGTGIGLALAQRIIAKHGGRIWAASEPDTATTFYLTLPK